MDAPAQLAGFAIEGRTKTAERDVFKSPMCDISAASGELSATSVNTSVVSPFCARIVVCLRTRGKSTVARAARANKKFRLFAVCSRLKSRGCGVTFPCRVRGQRSRFLVPESPFVGMRVFYICSKSTFAFDQYQRNFCSVFLFLKSLVHGGSMGSLGGYWKVLDEEIAADTTERNVTLSPSRFAERQAEGPPLSTKNLS